MYIVLPVYLTLEQSVYSPTCVFDIRTVYVVLPVYLTLEQSVCSPTCVFDIRTECM